MTSINSYINNDDEKNHKSYEKIGRIYNLLLDRSIVENKGHIIYLKKLLQTEGDINYRISESGVPNLLSVVPYRHLDHLKLLLDHGADFTKHKVDQDTTFMHAAIEDKLVHGNWAHYAGYIDAILAAQVKFNNPWNPSDRNGMTHFHVACIANKVKAVQFFLDNGVDVNQAVKMDSPYTAGYTPLHFAVKYQWTDVVKILLKHGANVHAKNAIASSPLHDIIKARIDGERGDVDEILQMFTNHIIKTNDVGDDSGFTHLHVACYLHSEFLIRTVLDKCVNLVDQAVNFDSPVCPGFTPLHFAVFCHFRVFELLLERGADIRAKNARGVTALDLLCLRNKHELREIHFVISTVSAERRVGIILSDDQTKLLDVVSAMMESKKKFVRFLNDRNIINSSVFVPLDSIIWPGYTVLHIAVMLASKVNLRFPECLERQHDSQMIKECLKRGADVTAKDAEGSTPIHLAFNARKYDIDKLLLDYHYERTGNPVDKNDFSHFHIACALAHQKVVDYFLSSGVDVNSPGPTSFTLMRSNYLNPANSTALHFSVAAECSRGIIEKLLEHGADINAKDANGFTPVHRLIFQKSPSSDGTEDFLLSNDCLENSTTYRGNLTHLHIACYYRHVSSVEKLLKNGADPNATVTYRSQYFLDDDLTMYYYGFSAPREDTDLSLSHILPKYFAGYTPVNFALCRGRDRFITEYAVKIIFMLIEYGVDIAVSKCKNKRASPLMRLFGFPEYHDDSYKTFSENAKIKARLEKELGITELHLACCLADCQLVEGLINSGINVNSRVNSDSPMWRGYTPLHCTVRRAVEKFNDENHFDCDFIDRSSKIIRLLTKHGADLLLTDEKLDTPLHLIDFNCKANQLPKVSLFVSSIFENLSDFSVNPTNLQGISLFHIACATHNEAAIEKFLKQASVDVNQAIGHFSEACPGSTALHLLVKYYPSHDDSSGNETTLKILDMLLDNRANLNVQDSFGNTPLFEAIQLNGTIRRVLIEKLINNGTDVHGANVKGITPFELLLTKVDVATSEEIELFMKAGCHFNTFNAITEEGYMATAFRSCYKSNTGVLKNQRFMKIINNPDIIRFTNAGRNAIHNFVSTNFDGEFFERRSSIVDNSMRPIIEAYTELIKWLSIRGCDIDKQDNQGRTALHLAVRLNNVCGVAALLNNGADVNLTDDDGKTIFKYFSQYMNPEYTLTSRILSMHAFKLKFCGCPMNEQTTRFQIDEENLIKDSLDGALHIFHEEIEKSTKIKIGSTFVNSLNQLLIANMDMVYNKMTMAERHEVDRFMEKIDDYQFLQIGCILKLKYRKTIERIQLFEPALTSFNVLIKWQLPDVCCRNIVSLLKNEDLKRLIAVSKQ